MSATIDVRELRVGMFVHLDMGWMSHPFPLSSFKISSADQIRTMMDHSGLSRQELLDGLSQALPGVIDHLTPDGRLPSADELRRLL